MIVVPACKYPVWMPEAYSRQSEEGDSQESKAGSEESSLPGTRGLIAVADSS